MSVVQKKLQNLTKMVKLSPTICLLVFCCLLNNDVVKGDEFESEGKNRNHSNLLNNREATSVKAGMILMQGDSLGENVNLRKKRAYNTIPRRPFGQRRGYGNWGNRGSRFGGGFGGGGGRLGRR